MGLDGGENAVPQGKTSFEGTAGGGLRLVPTHWIVTAKFGEQGVGEGAVRAGVDLDMAVQIIEELWVIFAVHGAFAGDAEEHLGDEVFTGEGEDGGDFVDRGGVQN